MSLECAVVERSMDRLPGRLDVGEVEHPAERGIDVAADGELDLERMAVQDANRDGLGQRGQAARAIAGERCGRYRMRHFSAQVAGAGHKRNQRTSMRAENYGCPFSFLEFSLLCNACPSRLPPP